jgi:hypothetical protein
VIGMVAFDLWQPRAAAPIESALASAKAADG